MLMPSETEIVENSRGVPPASEMPSLAAATWKSWVMLQGVCSPFMLSTPIIGFAMASSSSPIARMKGWGGARSRPSVVTRDRHFFMLIGKSLALLLKRRDGGRMLELRDVQFWQHSRRGVDVEHFLDRLEIWRGAGIAAEIIVLEKVGVQHSYWRLQLFGNHL